MELRGKTALVTGAARRLGRAIALELAREGCRLLVHYRSSTEQATAVVEEIESKGGAALALRADLARAEEVEALFREVEKSAGSLDILVNNAAGFESAELTEIDASDWDAVMAVNLRAPFLCTRHAAELMRRGIEAAGGPALIVNLGDLSGIQAWRGYAHHGVSKAGLLHLTKLAARELAPAIRVNAVVPGPILPPPGMDPKSQEWHRIGQRVPLARAGEPSEVAQAIVFLAEADYVTGQVLYVDGGEHLMGTAHR